jgi:beta-galactosidase
MIYHHRQITLRSWLAVALAGLAAAACVTVASTAGVPTPVRTILPFDRDWRFLKADAPGAERPDFAHAGWRVVNLPHDWSIEGPFDQKNPAGAAGGFLPAGIGWYRKQFTLPAADAGRRVFVEFDGVMANSDVWINGVHLGNRPYGYVSFGYELTDHLKSGDSAPNVLAVRVDDSRQPASRWYEGAGIYRHVRLVVTDPVHLEKWGTFVTTPHVAADEATVHVHSAVVNQSGAPRNVTLRLTLFAPDGRLVRTVESAARTVPAGQPADFDQDIAMPAPECWDVDHPALYRLVTEVHADGATLDDETTPFGIREARFDAATGFWLNGRNLKLKGVCLHDDASAFGMAVPLGLWARRLAALKELGVNAIRTAHNPPAPEFLELCDRLGFLVMDEQFDCWTVAKNPYDYHLYFNAWSKTDTRDTVRRDRNHPSIILYSAGNEIHDTPQADLAKRILAGLVAVFHDDDPTRPVTQALLRPERSHDYDNGLADLLDVIGTNYRNEELIAAHAAKPTRKIVGTENRHDLATWLAVRDTAAYAGEFIWSGIDYLGEAWFWPNVASSSGLLDRTAQPRPDGYQVQSWWSDRPMVYAARRIAPTPRGPTDPGYGSFQRRRPQVLFADWNPRNPAPHDEDVEIYSNCEQVELVLNGQSLGAQDRAADLAPRNWKVPYAPGTLQAIGRNHGQVVAQFELRTAGPPARILLTSRQSQVSPAWDDVADVTALIVDANGVVVPDADNLVTFAAAGPGVIAAVDSANNASHEPFQATARHAYQGRCLAYVRATAATGSITISASAPGLEAGQLSLNAVPAPPAL